MSTLAYIIIFISLGSLLALVGGFFLLMRKRLSHTVTHALAAFAAGSLLGAAFLDLLPEAIHHVEEAGGTESEITVFSYALGGILFFFLLERVIHWFHHHHREHTGEEVKPVVPLVVFGDSVHNFIDGVVIGAAFLADIQLGMITTFAVLVHEFPQEIGDFGILLHQGLSRTKVLLYNLLSQLTAVLGGILAYVIGSSIEGVLPILLAGTSGFFIYIALSDLVPDIHSENKRGFALMESACLFLGILLIWFSVTFLHH